jgi:mRNA interferase MazF
MTIPLPKRGEVWRINFDPTLGAEIMKIRPAVVISSNALGKLPLKIVVPITGWKSGFADDIWHIRLTPTPENGLTKESAVDLFHVRGVDILRFIDRVGKLTAVEIEEIVQALAIVVELS